VAQFLVKVKTHAEVLEYAGAFLQLYREEGWYLERTVHFVHRVGLDYVKARVLDDAEGRKSLHERLLFALDGEPDPWAERARGAARGEFEPLRAEMESA
jgi:nitrite reductase (NADH) large subunit